MANKRYLYKCYRHNVYVGMLKNVVSEFGYSQDINTAGPKLTVTLANTLEDAGAAAVFTTVTNEDDIDITNEDGEPIYSSLDYVFATNPIDLGNRVVVYLYYDNAVNGTVVFDGIITDFEADEKAGKIDLQVTSYGVQLDNYLVTLPANSVLTESVVSSGSHVADSLRSAPPDGAFNYYLAFGQTFQVATPVTVAAIRIWLWRDSSFPDAAYSTTLTLQQGAPNGGGPVLGTVSRNHTFQHDGLHYSDHKFAEPIALAPGTDYSFTVTNPAMLPTVRLWISRKDPGGYASGQRYYNQSATGWGTGDGMDLAFQVLAGSGNAYVQFNSQDPGSIVRQLLDNYQTASGSVDYTDSTVELTNTVVTYTFKGATVYEGVRKSLELAPANWYWYVDPATRLLHFHRLRNTPDHTFIKGKHLTELKLGQTLDDMKNTVLFSGGEVGGVNLTRQYANARSVVKYGAWLERLNDGRVTLESTAGILSRGVINQNSWPMFRTEIEIPAAVYDIETIEIGDVVAFGGFNSFTDSLMLQVTGKTGKRSAAVLRLATNPPSVSHRIEDIRRNLDALYTANNATV